MKHKRNSQTEPLKKALAPLDQINPLPPSLSPAQITARLRRLEPPRPAGRRTLTLRHIAVAAAALAIVLGAAALWKGLPYLEIVNSKTGETAPLAEVLQDYSKIEAYFQGLKTTLSNEAASERLNAPGQAPAEVDPPKAGAAAGTTQAAPENGSFGKTNTQIAGIDEADILKNDGAYLYFVPSEGTSIQIISPQPAASMKVLSTLTIPQEKEARLAVNALYVKEDRLVAVCDLMQAGSSGLRGIGADDAVNGCMAPVPICDTRILIYDISDRSAPKLLRSFTQDGSLLSSRMLGGTLYLITQYTVDLSADGALKDYIPTTTDGQNPPKKLAAADIQLLPGAKTPNYLIVSALDVKDVKKEPARKAVLGSGDQVYCHTDALYVADASYEGEAAFTTIYGFPLTDNGLGDCVTGRVRGHALNQFSLDSYGGALRIATTETVKGVTSSRVTILDQTLKTLSTLPNLAPGEQIYAVRFLGAKGYVVTFRQTDPLFVIDLSDTGAPKVLGKLKIPGFSSYLHPVGDDLLLGIGQDADAQGTTRGVKLSLFDVSRPESPKELDSLLLPKGSQTDALSQHKSILFLPEQNAFALPVSQEAYDNAFHAYYQDACYCVFSIRNNQIELRHTLRNYTQEEQRAGSYGDDCAILRGTYIGDTLYTVSNGRVCAFSYASGQQLGRLHF